MDTKKIAQGVMSALIFLAPVLTEPSLAWQNGKGEDRLPPAASASSSPSAAKAESSQSTRQARVVAKGQAPSAGSAGYFPNVTLLTQPLRDFLCVHTGSSEGSQGKPSPWTIQGEGSLQRAHNRLTSRAP